MLGTNLKSLPDVELGDEGTAELRGYRRGPDAGSVMPKRAKAAATTVTTPATTPTAGPRGAELRVFKASSAEGRLPGSNLRKQKSLTNLAFLTDAEKKRQLYEPRWSDDMAKAAATVATSGRGGGGGGGGGGPRAREASTMSRSLSRSEHSLLPPRPAGPAKPPASGKPSRIPRGPYAEVKPLSKAPEAGGGGGGGGSGGGGGGGGGKCDDELLGGKGPAAAGAEEKPYLKVDPELVVTVLGDLEQLLFSQMLGECGPPGAAPLPCSRPSSPSRPRCSSHPEVVTGGWDAGLGGFSPGFCGVKEWKFGSWQALGSSPRGSAISGEATQRGVAPCLQVGTHRLGVPRCVFGHSPVLNQP